MKSKKNGTTGQEKASMNTRHCITVSEEILKTLKISAA